MKANIHIINGVNLNLLGLRETGIYGSMTLKMLEDELIAEAQQYKMNIVCFQTNHEGALIDYIHQCHKKADFIIINPGAFTHSSIGLRDALLGVNIPFIEVHISNIYSRENFRHHSFLSDIAKGVLCGFGVEGYKLALKGAFFFLQTHNF